jgi:hypothetical protein
LFVDLIDHAARGAFAKQHGGRTLEHFHSVQVEGVAFDQGRVAQAVYVNVASLLELTLKGPNKTSSLM